MTKTSKTTSKTNGQTPVEPGQSGSYGTDRLKVKDAAPQKNPGPIDTHTPDHERARSEGNSAIGNPAASSSAKTAHNKVDTGATPSVGSSPSRQR